MTFGNLVAIELTSGMSEEGLPIVSISAVAEDGRVFQGQLSPTLVRGLGTTCFVVAESAENDAIVFALLQKDMLMDVPAAVSFISKVRDLREETDAA